MSVRSSAPLQCSLPDGLTLRTVRDARDVARVAGLASVVFGPEVGLLEEHLLARFPGMEPADQFFVETAEGEVVSMLCLIPWTWRYGPVSLTVGEMGIVATDPAYRRRGLVRAQVDAFKQRLAQRDCVLSCIQGIPYYYRQFGYDYALPLEGGLTLELRHAPEDPDHGYAVRAATPDDLDALAMLYDQSAAGLPLHAARGRDVWRFLLGPEPEGHATIHRTSVICADDGRIAGYARLPQFHFGDELVVDEASNLSLEAAQTLLAHLRRDAALIPLLLCHQTLDEVRAAYPDTGVHGVWRLFVETLFPKVQAFTYPGY